jgi:hypothetical protein
LDELLITLLEVLGLLLLAAGAAAALWPDVGAASLAAGGVVVLAGAAWANRPKKSKPEGR